MKKTTTDMIGRIMIVCMLVVYMTGQLAVNSTVAPSSWDTYCRSWPGQRFPPQGDKVKQHLFGSAGLHPTYKSSQTIASEFICSSYLSVWHISSGSISEKRGVEWAASACLRMRCTHPTAMTPVFVLLPVSCPLMCDQPYLASLQSVTLYWPGVTWETFLSVYFKLTNM